MTIKHVALCCCLMFIIGNLIGCGYPEVSPKTYELAKALFSACNRKHEEQLAKVDQIIESSLTQKEITSQEAGWLTSISKTAHDGDWENAAAQARKLMQDQVKTR